MNFERHSPWGRESTIYLLGYPQDLMFRFGLIPVFLHKHFVHACMSLLW